MFRKDNLFHNMLLAVELSFLLAVGGYLSAEIAPINYGTDSFAGLVTSPVWIIRLFFISFPFIVLFGVTFSMVIYQLFGSRFALVKMLLFVIYSGLMTEKFLSDSYTTTIWNRYLLVGVIVGFGFWLIDRYQRNWLS